MLQVTVGKDTMLTCARKQAVRPAIVYRTVRYVEQAADNKWVIKEDPLCLIDLLNAIHVKQCCGGVADEDRETTDATAYDPAKEMVRMTGAVGYSVELVSLQVSSQSTGVKLTKKIRRVIRQIEENNYRLWHCNVMSTDCTVVAVSFQYPSRWSFVSFTALMSTYHCWTSQ